MSDASWQRRAMLTVVLPTIGVGLLGWWLLDLLDVTLPLTYALALALTGFGLFEVAKQLVAELYLPARTSHRQAVDLAEPSPLLAPLERRLESATHERRIFVAAVQPGLKDIARARLRTRHGLDIDSPQRQDQDRVRRALGDELWQWMTTTDRDGRPPTPPELQRMVEALERL